MTYNKCHDWKIINNKLKKDTHDLCSVNNIKVNENMEDHQSELIIKSAALLAKDLLADNRLYKIYTASKTTESDSDDDLDLFFYSQLMKKRKISSNDNANRRTNNIAKCKETTAKRGQGSFNTGRTSEEPSMNHLFLKFLRECEDITFENQFKMTRSTFQSLVRLLTPNIHFENNKEMINLPTTSLILIGLWLLTSHESLKSTADRFNVSERLCRLAFKRLRDAIKLNKRYFISWPNKERAKKITEEFNEYLVYENKFPNICGVIGCTDITIPLPDEFKHEHKSSTIIKLQCVCDAKGEFLDSFVANESFGSNVSVFNRSIKPKIENGELYIAPKSHLIGDKSYPIKQYLMVPFKEFRKTHIMNEFNLHLELSRKIIDIAIKRLFGRFAKIKNLDLSEAIHYVEMACAIHNYCIQQNDSFYLDIGEDDTSVVNSKNTCHDFTVEEQALEKRKLISETFGN